MSNSLSALLLCCLLAPPAGIAQRPVPPVAVAPAATKANTLTDGTAVKMRLMETISSENAKVGQQVPLEVTEDVLVDGRPVIAKGAVAIATVTTAEPKKRMGRGGKLDVNVDSTRTVANQKVQLRAVREDKGGGHVGSMTVGIVATSLVFFPAAPLFLLMHGKDITIPQGTEVTAFVQGDTQLEPMALASTVPAAATNIASLTVDSNVPSADIEIDGTFVGSTPSTVSVASGSHTISVKKAGYLDWTRTMPVAGSGVKVSATLETATSIAAAH